ncbi:hypothetical protein K0M31_014692 [Melipona bicolor]|uniref:Uncharacterized protein n=1 Tax=Melipona bicolor TaxID=60889 RepID=A0AA40FI01_9HYME|nr:hypothetical protein K0M31_014692 [Melipona bicolor]
MAEVPDSRASPLIRVETLATRQAYAEQRELEDFLESVEAFHREEQKLQQKSAGCWTEKASPRNFSRCNLLPAADPNEK